MLYGLEHGLAASLPSPIESTGYLSNLSLDQQQLLYGNTRKDH